MAEDLAEPLADGLKTLIVLGQFGVNTIETAIDSVETVVDGLEAAINLLESPSEELDQLRVLIVRHLYHSRRKLEAREVSRQRDDRTTTLRIMGLLHMLTYSGPVRE